MNMPYFTPTNFSKSRNIYKSNYYHSKTNNNINLNNNTNKKSKTINSTIEINQEQIKNNSKTQLDTSDRNSSEKDDVLFEIFGLKIYFDDVLIICILLFLYQEGIQDEYLFIALILLLLS